MKSESAARQAIVKSERTAKRGIVRSGQSVIAGRRRSANSENIAMRDIAQSENAARYKSVQLELQNFSKFFKMLYEVREGCIVEVLEKTDERRAYSYIKMNSNAMRQRDQSSFFFRCSALRAQRNSSEMRL